MRHDIVLDGAGFRIRPVERDDAAFILSLRTDPRLNRFINATPPRLEEQLAWQAAYEERPGDWYFLIETRRDGGAEGTIGIYDHDRGENAAEWGRWVLRHGSLAAIESACLIYDAAFDVIGLEAVYCRTMAENKRVVSFHDSSGAERTGQNDKGGLFVEHRMTPGLWAQKSPALRGLAQRLAARMEPSA